MSKNSKTKINIEHIAQLSKLSLSKKESKKFSEELKEIINYVDELEEINTSSVLPTSQTTGLENVTRDDEVGVTLTQEKVLSQNENIHNGYFSVDMILENKEI